MTKRPQINKRFFSLFLLLGVFSFSLSAQHPSWLNYNTNDGLPGNEVYDMIQDSRGYLWFATNQGICRFNGYEFIRPVDTSAMRGSAAFNPTEDPEGNIWFNHIDHSIHFIENDTVRTWAFNSVIDQYRGKFTVIERLAIADDGTVWLALENHGLLEVYPDGTHRVIPEMEDNCLVFTTVGRKVMHSVKVVNIPPAVMAGVKGWSFWKGYEVIHWEGGRRSPWMAFFLPVSLYECIGEVSPNCKMEICFYSMQNHFG
ncbi:MAG: hypothetical protein IPL49_03235 [Saprospirales bacterium]|nr:hypothetical protein [Saprospirales bacterium]